MQAELLQSHNFLKNTGNKETIEHVKRMYGLI